MRAYLRASGFLLSGGVLGLALASGAGCGGADSQDVFGPIDGAVSSSSSGTSGSSSGTSGASGTSGTSGTSGSSSGTSGSSGVTDAAPDSNGNCPSETEPNDNKNEANTIGTTMCGTLAPRNDQDFLTFTLPLTAKSLSITYTGDVTVEVTTTTGGTVTLGGDVKVPFFPGERYYIEVRDGQSASTPWQVDVDEK